MDTLAAAIWNNLEPVEPNSIEQFLHASIGHNPTATALHIYRLYLNQPLERAIEYSRFLLQSVTLGECTRRFLTQFLDYCGEDIN